MMTPRGADEGNEIAPSTRSAQSLASSAPAETSNTDAVRNSPPTPRSSSRVASSGLAAVLGEDFDVWQAVGGVRGLVETVAPGLIFIIVFLVTHQLVPSIVAPVIVAVLAIGLRAVQRIDVMPALGGLLGILISAVWAWRSGEASDYFTWGLVTNGAYLGGLLVSMALRWPALGLLIGFLRGDATAWRNGPRRNEPEQRLTRRRYWQVTWLWVGLFAARLLVQAPLLLAHATTALAVTRLIMGPFLFALVAWLTWMLVRGLPPVTDPAVNGDYAPDGQSVDSSVPSSS